MRRADTIRRFLPIGVRAQIFRKRWVRSSAVKPFMMPVQRSNTPLVLVFLSVAGVLGGCHHESQLPTQPPRAVRLVTVATPQISGGTLRYPSYILPFAQVHLMFRSSASVSSVQLLR